MLPVGTPNGSSTTVRSSTKNDTPTTVRCSSRRPVPGGGGGRPRRGGGADQLLQLHVRLAELRDRLAAGAGERDALVIETLTAFRRAGCSGVLTYHAAHAARLLGGPLLAA